MGRRRRKARSIEGRRAGLPLDPWSIQITVLRFPLRPVAAPGVGEEQLLQDFLSRRDDCTDRLADDTLAAENIAPTILDLDSAVDASPTLHVGQGERRANKPRLVGPSGAKFAGAATTATTSITRCVSSGSTTSTPRTTTPARRRRSRA